MNHHSLSPYSSETAVCLRGLLWGEGDTCWDTATGLGGLWGRRLFRVAALRILLGDSILGKQITQDVWPREASVAVTSRETSTKEDGQGPLWGVQDLSAPFLSLEYCVSNTGVLLKKNHLIPMNLM